MKQKEEMTRILCLDVGEKRIGLAVSDTFGWTAQGLSTMTRRQDAQVFSAISELCREYEVEHVIVGIPLDQEGEMGPQAKKVEAFRHNLEHSLHEEGMFIPVEGIDERYSTKDAEERLLEQDVSRAKRKKVIDKMAAVVILESYLRSLEGKKKK